MDRRAAERQWIAASVTFCARRQSIAATAYDISTDGCMLQTDSEIIEVGDAVAVQFRDFDCPQGNVVWRKHRNVGIEFNVPLPSWVVDAIVREDYLFPSLPQRHRAGDYSSERQRNPSAQTTSTLFSQFPPGLVLRTPLERIVYQIHYGGCVAVILACAVQLGLFR